MLRFRLACDRFRVRLGFALGSTALLRYALRTRWQQFQTKTRKRRRSLAAAAQESGSALARVLLSVEWQLWLVLGIATAITVTLQYNMPLWYGGSDHADYYWYGRYILGDSFMGYALPANWRTPGMGILHILTGTVLFDTWKGFIALYAAISIAIPLLFYLMVRPHSRNFALLAALIIILSMTPFVYANVAGSDHPYFFFHALLLLLCVRYFQTRIHPSPALLASIVGVAAFANLVRPVGAIIFWMFIVYAAILRPRDWRRLAVASGVYVMLMAGWILWDRNYGTNGGDAPGNGYSLPNTLASTAERRLAEAYFSPAGLRHAESDAAAVGYPQSQMLRATLQDFISRYPHEWQAPTLFSPPSLFASYAKDPNGPEDLLAALFSDRNSLYFGFIAHVVRQSLGDTRGLALLYGVAGEHGTTGLLGIFNNFAAHPSRLLLGVTPNLTGRNLFSLLYQAGFRSQVVHVHTISQIPSPILSPDLGPATALILKIVRQFIDDYPQYWPKPIAERYAGDPDAYFRLVVSDDRALLPEGFEGFMYLVVNWYLGAEPAGRVYARAAFEILHRYPKLAMLTYDNFLNFTVVRDLGSVTAPLDHAALYRSSDAYFETRTQDFGTLSKGLARGLVPVITSNPIWENAVALQWIVYQIAPAFVFLLIAALPFLRGPATIAACLFLLLDYGYEVATIAVFSPWGAPRYEANFYLLPFVISCMIFGQAISNVLSKRRSLHLKHTT